jgi:hypothetical protein
MRAEPLPRDNPLATALASAAEHAPDAKTRRWLDRLRLHGEFVQLIDVEESSASIAAPPPPASPRRTRRKEEKRSIGGMD